MNAPSLAAWTALLTALLLGGTPPARAQALRAGEVFPFVAESPHPYASPRADEAPLQLMLHHPGATYLAIHFERFQLAPGDAVVVRSPDGAQRHVLTGRGRGNLGSFWAPHIKGERAVVELLATRRAPGRAWGFAVDRYAAGNVDLGGPVLETVCAPDDRRNAVCYEGTAADAYDHGRPVARLLVEGTLLCSGFLVGCEGHLLTSNHCIDDPALSDPATAAANTDYEFLSEAPFCGSANALGAWPGSIWPGAASLVAADAGIDYALILLAGNPQDTYGSLVLDDRAAIAGEAVYIPQHGSGWARQLGISSSDPNDTGGVCRVFSTTEVSCYAGPANIGYHCDTSPGSSGAPLMAAGNHKVLGMHACGGCPATRNTAATGFRIINDLGALLPPSALGTGAVCGDGMLQCGELCDGGALDGETCASQGFTVGSLSCNNRCDGFVTSQCHSLCGDGLIAPDEVCEGSNLNGQSCTKLGYAGGTLACDISCDLYDTSLCTSVCGDALLSPDETCDGSKLGGQNCASLGLESGTLACAPGCDGFVTSGCCGAVDLTVSCSAGDTGSATKCDNADGLALSFLKPSPPGTGMDVYRADEGDLFAGSIGPVTCLENDVASAVPAGGAVMLALPAFQPGLGQVAYYLVSCDRCGALLGSGISRLGGIDTQRMIGPACTACP